MPEPTFRQATAADARAIASVGAELWEELGDKSGLPGRMTAEAVAERLASYGQRGGMFVCEADGSVCGFAILAPDADDPEEAVMGVWLLPEARRRGIGRELALMATDFARAAGFQRLKGTLPPGNEPALSFFSDIGSLAQMVGQGMEYELPL